MRTTARDLTAGRPPHRTLTQLRVQGDDRWLTASQVPRANNTLNQSGDVGPGEIFGLGGSDEIRSGTGAVTVDGGSGDDTVILQFGNTGQVTGGTENDSIYGLSIGSMVLYGNEGADTIWSANATAPQTVLGGNDSADGSDSIYTGVGADLVFGNGGNDTIRTTGGADTMIGGVGNDSFYDNGTTSSQLAWGNEGNDIFNIYGGSDTIFAGQGNDSVWATGGTGLYYMGENNDTFYGAGNASGVTVAGGNDFGDGADFDRDRHRRRLRARQRRQRYHRGR